jgi:hypothetical protein
VVNPIINLPFGGGLFCHNNYLKMVIAVAVYHIKDSSLILSARTAKK